MAQPEVRVVFPTAQQAPAQPVESSIGKWVPWILLGVVVVVFVVYILYSRSKLPPPPIVSLVDKGKSKDKKNPDDPTCTRSQVIIKNPDPSMWRTVGPGTYPIDKNSYEMQVYPPMEVEASGPTPADHQTMDYRIDPTQTEGCPNYSNLVLDKDKNYTSVKLTKIG